MRNTIKLVLLTFLLSLIINGITQPAIANHQITKSSTLFPTAGKVPACIYNGKSLYGNVHIVKYAYQADMKVFQAKYAYQSDLKVFSTRYSYQATKCGLWNFVNYAYQAKFKVFFTKYAYQADFQIYFVNYAYQAGTN